MEYFVNVLPNDSSADTICLIIFGNFLFLCETKNMT